MRSGILIHLIVVGLCACATAALPQAQISPGDILIASTGDPAVLAAGDWDAAAHLAADWEYVSANMTSQIYNPAVRPDAQAAGPQWSLSVSSIVSILNKEGLIAWSTSPGSAKAYDANDQVVVSSESSSSFVRWYRQPDSWRRVMARGSVSSELPRRS